MPRRILPGALTPIVSAAVLAVLILVSPDSAPAQEVASTGSEALEGLRFRTIGPATMSGRIVDLAVAERDVRVFYVASATGGVWKTTNGGVTFRPVFQDEATHSVGDIALHQVDTSIVWVGTGERANRQSSSWGDGVYKSTDGGRTWRNMGLRDSHHIGRIALHPTDTRMVYVAAMGHLWGPNEERGLYKTVDGGESWTKILQVDDDTGVVDVALDPLDPEIVYAATYQRRRRGYGFHGGGPGSGLWKSTDGGESWTELSHLGGLPQGDYGRIGISIFRRDPRIVYVCVEQGERYSASTTYEQRLAGIYRSEDRGETWAHMSDWNPRPMYASQILVDPSDDQRVYMENSFSFSDDGGRTFTAPRNTLHGDDRFVWVNPHDSRHVMKADDGGLGISYDRARTWLYVTHLPLSQFYRVSYDLRKPYWVYGGLQDNGSWAGPSATYRAEGVLNHDWMKWGGGDGFLNLVDTTDNRTLYVESQYLGLSRVDLITGQRTSIRPGDPHGAISARKNWNTWGDPEAPEQRLGNAMAPANWDGPFVLSPHDPSTIYAGTNILWKSTDRGENWTSLGELTTGVDRRTLRIMEEIPTAQTLSLDDGIPYYPSLTAIAESPLEEGVLYVGTDDGNVQVSRDGGATWANVVTRISGLPESSWINGIEASRFAPGRLYLAANNYRNDDYSNYLFRSDDYGSTWTDITGDLPPERVVRTVREDPRNPEVLYLGTEFGAFYSPDAGGRWIALTGGLPTMAVNDLVVHPRDNDLILGTHSRGIWILDNVNALQEPGSLAAGERFHLFSMEAAEQIRYRSEKGHTGNMIFQGENPPAGAIIDYWLGEDVGEATITVHDAAGSELAHVLTRSDPGMNRAIWNLRHSEPDQRPGRGPSGPLVVPGRYTVRLTVDGEHREQALEVLEDPRIQVDPEVRRAWTENLLELGELVRQAISLVEEVAAISARVEEGLQLAADLEAKLRDLQRETGELTSRIRRLQGGVSGVVAPLTGDQLTQRSYYIQMLGTLTDEVDRLKESIGT